MEKIIKFLILNMTGAFVILLLCGCVTGGTGGSVGNTAIILGTCVLENAATSNLSGISVIIPKSDGSTLIVLTNTSGNFSVVVDVGSYQLTAASSNYESVTITVNALSGGASYIISPNIALFKSTPPGLPPGI